MILATCINILKDRIQLQKKIAELDKEVGITTIIIDMIETERVLTLDEKQGKMLLLDSKRNEE